MEIETSSGELVDCQEIIQQIKAGETLFLHQDEEPVAVIIPFDDFLALQDQLEELSDLRAAEAAIAEYERDPSGAISIEEMIAMLKAGYGPEEGNSAER